MEASPRLHYPDPPLGDEVVALRPWTVGDLPCVAEASRDPVIPEGTTVPVPFTDAEGRAFIERQHARCERGEGVSLALTSASTDTARGIVVLLHRHPGTVEIGYWVLASARRRGLARRGVPLVARWGVTQDGIERVEARVEPANTASQAVLAGAGFHHEGTLRSALVFETRRADAQVWSLLPTDVT